MIEVFAAIQLGVATGIFRKKDAVADLDIESDECAVLKPLSLADCDYFALLRLFLGGIGNDDSAARGFFFFDPLHYDAVV